MARAIYGGVGLQGLSGSINKQAGGHTFTKNNVVRRRVVPTNPQTADQSEIRGAFAFFTSAWAQELDDGERSAWNEARNNNSYYLKQDELNGVQRKYGSAKDLFVAMNINYLIQDNSLNAPVVNITTPPDGGGIDTLGIESVVADDSANTVIVTYSGTQTEEVLVMYATPPVSAGNMRATSVKNKFRLILAGMAASPDTVAQYQTRFGALTGKTGSKIFWRFDAININTGKSRPVAAGVSIIVA